jgi:hypothetical protein
MSEAPWRTSHEWVRRLSGQDTQVLLMHLCQAIDTPTVSREDLVTLVQGWRRNALKAVTADDWTADVDRYLEVKADARLALLAQERLDENAPGEDAP